jgi:protein ImuB
MAAWGVQIPGQEEAADGEEGQILDALINRLGRVHVLKARVRESHAPEQARLFVPVGEERDERGREAAREWGAAGALLLADRPSVLLDPPEAAEVIALLPDHPPSWLRWRHAEHPLKAGAGPERIVTAWWRRKALSTRDYFKVQTAVGQWLWVYREVETSRWYVHGVWG